MSSNTNIAKKARKKAEADFPTWLMTAKLGGFDDLSSNARSFLINYQSRLDTMSEAESTALAIREVYSAYYSEMGVMRSGTRPKSQPSLLAARHSMAPKIRKFVPLLILAGMVALILAYRFLTL